MAIFKIFKIKQNLFKHVNGNSIVYGNSDELYISVTPSIKNFYSKATGFITGALVSEIEIYDINGSTPITKTTVDEVINELIRVDYRLFKHTNQTNALSISGTLTNGGTAQVAIPANDVRVGFELQNTSSSKINIGLGVVSSATSGFVLDPGAIYYTNSSTIATGNIWVYGSVTGQSFTFIEY